MNMELREKVEAGIRSANKNFVIAKAGMDEATLNTALMAPKQEVDLEVGQKNVMSEDIPVFETKTRTDMPMISIRMDSHLHRVIWTEP